MLMWISSWICISKCQKEDVKTAKQQLQQQGLEDDNSIREEIEDDDIYIQSWRWHSILRQLHIDGYEEILRTNFQLIKQVKFWKMPNVIQTQIQISIHI